MATAAPRDVWRVLADPYSYARWVIGTKRVRAADPEWPAPGSRLHHRFGPPPLRIRDHTTVLAAEPESRLVLAARARPFGTVTATLTLTPIRAGTRILLREQMDAGLGAWLPGLGHAVQRRRLRRSVRTLAHIASNRPGKMAA